MPRLKWNSCLEGWHPKSHKLHRSSVICQSATLYWIQNSRQVGIGIQPQDAIGIREVIHHTWWKLHISYADQLAIV